MGIFGAKLELGFWHMDRKGKGLLPRLLLEIFEKDVLLGEIETL